MLQHDMALNFLFDKMIFGITQAVYDLNPKDLYLSKTSVWSHKVRVKKLPIHVLIAACLPAWKYVYDREIIMFHFHPPPLLLYLHSI